MDVNFLVVKEKPCAKMEMCTVMSGIIVWENFVIIQVHHYVKVPLKHIFWSTSITIIETARVEICLEANSSPSRPASSTKSIEEEIDRLNTMYQKGRLSETYYDQEYERLTSALSGVHDQKTELQQKRLQCVSEQFSGEWKRLYLRLDTIEHKRAFWKQTIEEILVDQETKKIKGVKLLI